jgi:rhamnogalacturonan endolyase
MFSDGAADNLAWTSASIIKKGKHKGVPFVDIMFTADVGDMHWVIFEGQHGAYQYFVNHNLPTLGEFRTLWRLDNTTFPNGRTIEKDGALPPLSDYIAANKVQDETWLAPDGKSYITKYDWTSWVREQDYYGVYGNEVGSWYINPGKVRRRRHKQTPTRSASRTDILPGLLQRQPRQAGVDGRAPGAQSMPCCR